MERRLFTDLLDSDAAPGKERRGRTLPLSLSVHALVFSALIIVPLLASGEMPAPTASVKAFFVEPSTAAPPPPPPPPPPPAGVRAQTRPTAAPTVPTFNAPMEVSPEIALDDEVLAMAGGTGSEGGGIDGGEADGIRCGVPGGVLSPEPPPVVQAVRPDGSTIKLPVKVKDLAPVYPTIAKAAGIQGMVILECTIDPHGAVKDVRVLRGHPLLDQAAVDAVRQWVYKPTLLNGVPVPVIMTVTVNFHLR